MKTSRPRVTSAHVIALIALFVALAGTSFAAVKLGSNAVKAKNIAPKAVKTSKLADGAVTNPKVAQGALEADRLSAAARSSLGGPPTTLPSGKTVKGGYDLEFTATAGGQPAGAAMSFGSAMASPPTGVFVPDGGLVPPNCSGGSVSDPKAAPGFLCIFESFGVNRNSALGANTTVAGFFGINSAAAGLTQSVGTWAATAP